jgi:hypothetical protein
VSFAAFAQAAPKVAVTSLVADQFTVTLYRDSTGTNLSNRASTVKMPGPMLDIALLKAAQDAIAKAAPGAAVFPLKVPAAGSNVDPALVYQDGKPDPQNVLVEALRKQGFTHLLTATKLRNSNIIALASGTIGTNKGALEGIGFYVDPTLGVENGAMGRSEGIIAPYVYIELRLVDLATLETRSQRITDNSVAASAQNKAGADAWGALTAEEKIDHLQRLIQRGVAREVPALFQAK